MNEDKLQNFYKNAQNLNPKFTMDYDAFKANMQDNEKRSKFYNNIRKLNPAFTMTDEEADAALGFASEQAEQEEPSRWQKFKNVIKEPNLFGSFGGTRDLPIFEGAESSHSTLANDATSIANTNIFEPILHESAKFGLKEGEDELLKKSERLKELQDTPVHEIEDKVVSDILEQEKTSIEKDLKKAPSYITRNIEDIESIGANAVERSLNTEDGRLLYVDINSKYMNQFYKTPEYATLIDDYMSGKITKEDIGDAYENMYGESIMEDYWNAIYKEDGSGLVNPYVNLESQSLQGKAISKSINNLRDTIKKQKESAIAVESKYYTPQDIQQQETEDTNKEIDWSKIDFEKVNTYTNKDAALASKNIRLSNSALDFVDKAEGLKMAVDENKGFLEGVGNIVGDIDTWAMSMNDMSNNAALFDCIEKQERGEELTEEEKSLMTAAATYMAASAFYSPQLNRSYKVGELVGHSVPFMVEFMLTAGTMSAIDASVKGATKTIAKGLLKFAEKELRHKIWKNTAARVAGSVLSKAVSSSVKAAFMSGTFGVPKIAAGTIEREIGTVLPSIEGGEIVYGGRENQQEHGKAVKNAIADTYIEYWSEMGLDMLSPIGKVIGASNFVNKLTSNKIGTFVSDIWNNPVLRKAMNVTQFHGFVPENIEELVGEGARYILDVDDRRLNGEFGMTKDDMINMMLSIGFTSMIMGSVGAVNHYGSMAANIESVKKHMTDIEKGEFDAIMKESRSGEFGRKAHDYIRNTLLNSKLTDEQKIDVIKAIVYKNRDLTSHEIYKSAMDKEDTDFHNFVVEQAKGVERDGKVTYAKDFDGKPLVITGGNVVYKEATDESGNPIRIVDVEKSGNIKVKYKSNVGFTTTEHEIPAEYIVGDVVSMDVDEFIELTEKYRKAQEYKLDNFIVGTHVYSAEDGSYIGEKSELEELFAKDIPESETTETKETGKSVKITIDGKQEEVSLSASKLVQNADGSINFEQSEDIVIMKANGTFPRGDFKKIYADAVSESLKNEVTEKKAKEAEAARMAKENAVKEEKDKIGAHVEEDVAAKKEAKRQTIIGEAAKKKSAKKFTPEETVVVLAQEQPANAVNLIGGRIIKLRTQIEDINSNKDGKDRDDLEKWEDTRELVEQLAAYESAVKEWLGEDALAQINAPVEVTPVIAPVVEQAEAPKVDEHKSKQLEIIQNSNPMADDIHTGIRTIEDIKTLEETLVEPVTTPDWTEENINAAIQTGTVRVYSSTPIVAGAFVTPSRMQAEDYAGGGQVYEAEVNVLDVAWIDSSEGQFTGELPAEPDTTPLPPAEPETKGAAIEPIDLGGDDIVFVSNSSNVTRVAQRKEDGNLYFVDNGKPVSSAWKETASKVKVYYNGRPYYLLSKTARIGKNGSVVGLNITVHLAPEMYTGKDSELNEIPRDKISLDEQGNQTATGNKLAERVANYKSLSDFYNKVIYNAGGVKLTLGELLEIPVVNANKGKGAPSWQFQVKRFIEQQEGKRNQTDVRADIEAGLKELIADWNAYVKANGLTDVVTEDNATDYYSRLKELGGYTSNGLLVQSTDFNGGKLNSADATKNPILQLLVMLDQASELTKEKGPSLKALEVSNIRGYVQKKPSSMTTEEIEEEMFDKNNQGERVRNYGISTQRYNALNAELERRQAPEREAQVQLEKELDEKERNQEEQLIDSYANEIVNLLAASSNGNAIQKAAARGRVIDMLKGNSTLRKGVYDKLASIQNEDSAEVIESATNLIAKHYPEVTKTSTKKAEQEKPKPATSTPSLKELNDEYNDIKSKLDEYYYETDEEIDSANKRLAELRALLENTEFMIGNVAESSASQEAKELTLAAEIQVLADSEEIEVLNVTQEQAEEARRTGKGEMQGSTPLMTSKGVIYGYALGNKIYLTPDGMNTNTPVHEYTHIWAKAMQKNNPKAWKSIVEQLKKAEALWNEVDNDPNYENIKNNEDAIASEVLSRYSGKNGAAKLEAEAERVASEYKGMEKGLKVKTLISRVKKALEKFWSWVGKDLFKIESFESVESIADRVLYDMLNNTQLNLDNSKKSSTFAENNENYERTDEFRELQERSLGLSQSDIARYQSEQIVLSDEDKRGIGGVFQRLMESERNGGRNGQWINLTGKGNQFKIAQVNPAIFHDIFQICRNYLPNGELVDLHDNYADCKCFISEDGLCGFAIEPDGNLISVYSLNPRDKKGFLYAIKDLIRQEGATHLDCFVSNKQPLSEIYQKVLGFHVASEMDYNMEFDHDNIAENHGMPKVAFMVDKPTEKREFDKDSYDAAAEYQLSQTSTAEREQIIAEAKANGTYMMHNGQPTNLTEDQWVTVRTQAFKDYFGDWINDKDNASVVLDENGEPLVVYHGSRMAGFDQFGRGEARDSQGIYTTPNRRAAESYATSVEEWKSEQTMPEAELGVPDHHGVYSLFVNMRNPKVIDFGGKRFDEYGEPKYEVATNEALDNGERGILFDTLEEAEAYIAEHPEEDLDYVEKRTTSDDMLVQAKEEGYDGVIFTNIIDSRYPDPITNYVPFESNQVKSATQNIGTFNPDDNRIEFMIGPAASKAIITSDARSIDAIARAKEIEEMLELSKVLYNPFAELPEELNWWHKLITNNLDRTEPIRLMMNSIKEWREEHGLEPMPAGYDIRTQIEAMYSKVDKKYNKVSKNEIKKLKEVVEEFKKVIEGSELFDKYKVERTPKQNGKPSELTSTQFIERYLMAMDTIERREQDKNPRGELAFAERMGVTIDEFVVEFHNAYGIDMANKLWDAVRVVTDLSLKYGLDAKLISPEEYERFKERRYYVPERDFAEVEANPELQVDSSYVRRGNRNKLAATSFKAKGGNSLAANQLTHICYQVYDAIYKAEANKIKINMYNLLRQNEGWCRKNHIPIPHEVWYEKMEDGTVVRMTDAPSKADRVKMGELKGKVRKLTEEMIPYEYNANEAKESIRKKRMQLLATIDAEKRDKINGEIEELTAKIRSNQGVIDDIQQDIDKIKKAYPYLDEYDAKTQMFIDRATQNKQTITVYIDGIAHEMNFPNMTEVAMVLNGQSNPSVRIEWLKKLTAGTATIFTTYDPRFWAVNLAKDVPFILLKGGAEYGIQFQAKFIANLAKTNIAVAKAVANQDYSSSDYAKYIDEFFAEGANTGYSTIPEIKDVKKTVESWGDFTSVGFEDLDNVLSFMSTWSETWTRFTAYLTVRQMTENLEDAEKDALSKEEAVRAAKNLSVNFNRKGLGSPFMNFFSHFFVFTNATVQGVSGLFRTFWTDKKGLDAKLWKLTRATFNMAVIPAFLGYLSYLLSPDDDKENYIPSAYDRDNKLVLGALRVNLNEQLKPFWVIGVNIAMGIRGRRNDKQIAESIISSTISNLLPLPQPVTTGASMISQRTIGSKKHSVPEIIQTVFTPSILKTMNDMANNSTFMGGKLRYDIGQVPEYLISQDEMPLSILSSEWLYNVAGGDTITPSKSIPITDENGIVEMKDLPMWGDVNPKEIEAWTFFVPRGFKESANNLYAAFSKEYDIELEHAFLISSFYRNNDVDKLMYSVYKKVKEDVDKYNERIKHYEQTQVGASIIANANIDVSERYAASAERAEKAYNFLVNNEEMMLMSELVKLFSDVNTVSVARRAGVQVTKDLEDALGNYTVEELNRIKYNIYRKMQMYLYEKEGITPTYDIQKEIDEAGVL